MGVGETNNQVTLLLTNMVGGRLIVYNVAGQTKRPKACNMQHISMHNYYHNAE